MAVPDHSIAGPGLLKRLASLGLAAAVALTLSACAKLGLPFGPAPLDTITTGSVAPAEPEPQPAAADIFPSDLDAIRMRFVQSEEIERGDRLPWTNPASGSIGAIEILLGSGDSSCHPFATTVNDLRGVRRYHSEACRTKEGNWQFSVMTPEDNVLL